MLTADVYKGRYNAHATGGGPLEMRILVTQQNPQNPLKPYDDLLKSIAFTGPWAHQADTSSVSIIGATKQGPDRWIRSTSAGPLCKLDKGWSQLLDGQARHVYDFIAAAPATIKNLTDLARGLTGAILPRLTTLENLAQQLRLSTGTQASEEVRSAAADQIARQISGEMERLRIDLGKLMNL